MRTKKIIGLKYKTKKVCIDRDYLKKFSRLDNKRKEIRSTREGVFKSLLGGNNYDAPLVINYVTSSKKMEVVDGNNRLDAVEKYLKLDQGNKVWATLHVYTNLTEEEKKEIYTLWNKGKKQSANDIVKQYEKEIDIFNKIKKDFPLSVTCYGSKTSIAFYRLVGAYIGSLGNTFKGGVNGSGFKFVDDSKKLGIQDYKLLKAFMKDYLQTVGPFKNNPWFKGTPLTALMRIWLDNRQNIPMDKFVGYVRGRVMNDYECSEIMKPGGTGATKWARKVFLRKINEGRSRNIFV